jgi:hypothetical protein
MVLYPYFENDIVFNMPETNSEIIPLIQKN